MTCQEIQAQIDIKAAELIPLQAALTVAQAAKIVSSAALIVAMNDDAAAQADLVAAQSAVDQKTSEKQTWEMFFQMQGC